MKLSLKVKGVEKLKISKLLKLSGFIVLVMLIMISASIFLLNITFKEEKEAIVRQRELKALGIELVNVTDYLTEQVRKYVINGDKVYYNNYLKEVKETQRRESIVKRLEELKISNKEMDLIRQSIKKSKMISVTEKSALNQAQKGAISSARRLIFGRYYEKEQKKSKDLISKFQKIMNQRVAEETKLVQTKANLILIITTILIFIMFVTLIIVFCLLYKKIKEPINQAVNFAQEIAKGNLNVSSLEVKTDDEIGNLIEKLNQMRISLKNIVTNILGTVDDLSAYSQQLSAAAEEGNATVALSNESLGEMTKKIGEISQAGKGTIDLVQNTSCQTELGSKNVQDTVYKMKEIDNSVAGTVEMIQILNDTSQEINEFVELIHNIAEQTTLLSLNAAIEAARAGEAGQGFAVVADEIKNLSEETTKATEDIDKLINQIQLQAQEGLDAIKIVASKAERGREVAEETGQIFIKVESSIQNTSAYVEQTVSSAQELAQNSSQVMSASNDVEDMSKEIADFAEELTVKSRELRSLIEKFNI